MQVHAHKNNSVYSIAHLQHLHQVNVHVPTMMKVGWQYTKLAVIITVPPFLWFTVYFVSYILLPCLCL